MTEQQKFAVEFTLLMPGQARPATYPIVVDAADRSGALAAAEAEWKKTISQYDVRVKQIVPKVASPSGATNGHGGDPQ